MKIGVLSDTHIPTCGEILPSPVLQGLEGADLIVHAGDLTIGSVLSDLKKIAPVKAVRGNMDTVELYRVLPEKRIITVGSIRIGLLHGHGRGKDALKRAREAFKGEELTAVVFGHSHIPYYGLHEDILYFNPGSPTDKRGNPRFSFGLLFVEGKEIRGDIIEFL